MLNFKRLVSNLAVLAASIVLCVELTAADIGPFFVDIEATGSVDRVDYRLSILADYECAEFLHEKQLRILAAPSPYYAFQNEPGFTASTGIAHYVTQTGDVRFCTDAIPKDIRKRLFVEVETQTGVKLQRGDQEEVETYALRRTISKLTLHCARALFDDVETITGWPEWPVADSPYRAKLAIQVRPESPSARIFGSLGPKVPNLRFKESNTRMGTIEFNVSLHDEIKPVLHEIASSIVGEHLPLLVLLGPTLDRGDLAAVAEINETPEQFPQLSGAMSVVPVAGSEERLCSAIGGTLTPEGSVFRAFHCQFLGQSYGTQSLSFHGRDNSIEFTASNQTIPFNEGPFAVNGSEEQQGVNDLMRLRLDFGKWAGRPGDSGICNFIRQLESSFERYLIKKADGNTLQSVGSEFETEVSFKSFASKLDDGGDWRLNATARSTETTFVVECEVGRDLHRFSIARELIATATVLKSH